MHSVHALRICLESRKIILSGVYITQFDLNLERCATQFRQFRQLLTDAWLINVIQHL